LSDNLAASKGHLSPLRGLVAPRQDADISRSESARSTNTAKRAWFARAFGHFVSAFDQGLGDVGYVEHRNVAWDTAGPKVKWIDCRARKRAGARSGFAAQIFRDLIGRPAVTGPYVLKFKRLLEFLNLNRN
jgi:hypothetical protein